MNVTKLTPPRLSKDDKYHSIVKAALAAIPGIGGSVAEIFALVIYPPLVERQQEWMDAIVKVIGELQQEKRMKIEDLHNDPQFIDALVLATQIATRTSVKEKLSALCNAVRNSTSPRRPDHARQQMFLRLVDEFTEWHLRLLKLVDDPDNWFGRYKREVPKGSMRAVITHAYTELSDRQDFLSLIWRDLYVRSLVKSERVLDEIYDFRGMLEHDSEEQSDQLTPMGKQFLRFTEHGNA
ncbi:MAG: hypothetical protein KAW56_06780 [Candidatus Marinimicrobia bacterium]|nr:hypothetical protein [Candidatus Neomarinimicrobiota bacterium]